MSHDRLADDDSPAPDAVLGALCDEDCRTVVERLDEPRTARELTERCDIPRSTLYRKLDRLTEATLLYEETERRETGSDAGRYEVNFEEVLVSYGDDHRLNVEIERPTRRADERFAELWSEVKKEV